MNETGELPSAASSASELEAGNDRRQQQQQVDVNIDEEIKRPQFGTRCLVDQSAVFEHNAWDNVVWDEELENEALSKIAVNSQVVFTEEQLNDYEANANCYWDKFYNQHQSRFFKDRHWLFTEFPELDTGSRFYQESVDKTLWSGHKNHEEELNGDDDITDLNDYPGHSAKRRFLEVGCGVGNTVFPVLQTNNDPTLFMYCCDFSKTAIDIVKEHVHYDVSRCHAFVLDITDETAVMPFPSNSLDAIILIFVLSAVKPDKMQSVINRLARCLKPGGMILFRDYGRYDMAQLRFKKGKCLGENFYVRGDGTQVYFFTQDDLRRLFTHAGLEERQNLIDRRLQVNRGRQLKMYRVWIQCKYQKPFPT